MKLSDRKREQKNEWGKKMARAGVRKKNVNEKFAVHEELVKCDRTLIKNDNEKEAKARSVEYIFDAKYITNLHRVEHRKYLIIALDSNGSVDIHFLSVCVFCCLIFWQENMKKWKQNAERAIKSQEWMLDCDMACVGLFFIQMHA